MASPLPFLSKREFEIQVKAATCREGAVAEQGCLWQDSTQKTVIGLLDIYGFEVLDTNRYGLFLGFGVTWGHGGSCMNF